MRKSAAVTVYQALFLFGNQMKLLKNVVTNEESWVATLTDLVCYKNATRQISYYVILRRPCRRWCRRSITYTIMDAKVGGTIIEMLVPHGKKAALLFCVINGLGVNPGWIEGQRKRVHSSDEETSSCV